MLTSVWDYKSCNLSLFILTFVLLLLFIFYILLFVYSIVLLLNPFIDKYSLLMYFLIVLLMSVREEQHFLI